MAERDIRVPNLSVLCQSHGVSIRTRKRCPVFLIDIIIIGPEPHGKEKCKSYVLLGRIVQFILRRHPGVIFFHGHQRKIGDPECKCFVQDFNGAISPVIDGNDAGAVRPRPVCGRRIGGRLRPSCKQRQTTRGHRQCKQHCAYPVFHASSLPRRMLRRSPSLSDSPGWGNSAQKQLPFPGSDMTPNGQSYLKRMFLTIESPSPVPLTGRL